MFSIGESILGFQTILQGVHPTKVIFNPLAFPFCGRTAVNIMYKPGTDTPKTIEIKVGSVPH